MWGVQGQRGGTAAAAAELGAALARLGLKSVEDLSVDNLEDLGAGRALEEEVVDLCRIKRRARLKQRANGRTIGTSIERGGGAAIRPPGAPY